MWFKAVQPIKEVHEHLQSVLLGGLDRLVQIDPFCIHIWVVLELGVLPLQSDKVVEEEVRCVLEDAWESTPGDVAMLRARDIGEHEGGVAGQGLGEDGGQRGECIVVPDSEPRGGAIGKDKNRSDRVDVLLDLSCNTVLVELVLTNTAHVGQPRRVEDADLGKSLCPLIRNTGAYHYTVVARDFDKVARVGLTLIIITTLLVRVIEDIEIVVINIFAGKDIANEFQD